MNVCRNVKYEWRSYTNNIDNEQLFDSGVDMFVINTASSDSEADTSLDDDKDDIMDGILPLMSGSDGDLWLCFVVNEVTECVKVKVKLSLCLTKYHTMKTHPLFN